MATKLLLIIAVALTLGTGCRKANKPIPENGMPADAGAAGTASDSTIQNKDLSYDAQGSDSGKFDGLYTVHFDFDKSSLTSEARSLLQKDAAWIKAHPESTIQIEGHTDRQGSNEYNLALGERRAKSVKEYLINLGVPGKRLSTISYGEERLLDTAETEAADAKNRRANFVPSK